MTTVAPTDGRLAMNIRLVTELGVALNHGPVVAALDAAAGAMPPRVKARALLHVIKELRSAAPSVVPSAIWRAQLCMTEAMVDADPVEAMTTAFELLTDLNTQIRSAFNAASEALLAEVERQSKAAA